MAFTLPNLPYGFDALEPHIDAMTMQIHHDKHHAAYVKNVNDAIAADKITYESEKDFFANASKLSAKAKNNSGGVWNHNFFWQIMKPNGGGAPSGKISEAINGAFGSFDKFKEQFNSAGAKQFGSGWVWLVRTTAGKFEIRSTPNQDNPLMDGKGDFPVFGNDVWEHAYYLRYQNKRPDYLAAWWNVVNWEAINKRLDVAAGDRLAAD